MKRMRFNPNKKCSDMEHFRIRISTVVQHVDPSWNALEPSLVLIYERLTDLGWVHYNGEIHIVEPETEESCHHNMFYEVCYSRP